MEEKYMGFLLGGQRQGYPQNPYYGQQPYMPYPNQQQMYSQPPGYGPPMTSQPQMGVPHHQHHAMPDPYGYQYDHGSYGYQQQPNWNYYQYNPYQHAPQNMPSQHPFYYEETEAVPVHATPEANRTTQTD